MFWLLTACGERPSLDGESGVEAPPCDNTVVPHPEDGETWAYYRTTVEADLRLPDPSARIVVRSPSGAVVDGTTTIETSRHYAEGASVVFAPDQPLTTNTEYAASLSWACGVTEWTFTTSSTGSPIGVSDLSQPTYYVDLDWGRWIVPAGWGELITQFIPKGLMIGIADVQGDSIVAIMAPYSPTEYVQDECVPTETVLGSMVANPYFEIDGRGAIFDLGAVRLLSPVITGAIAPTTEWLEGVTVVGQMDVWPLMELIHLDESCVSGGAGWPACRDTQCDTLTSGLCIPCIDGSGSTCFDFRIDNGAGEWLNLQAVTIDVTTVCANANCASPVCE